MKDFKFKKGEKIKIVFSNYTEYIGQFAIVQHDCCDIIILHFCDVKVPYFEQSGYHMIHRDNVIKIHQNCPEYLKQ